ncbi:Hypp4108 [Branchiostoma lanceolatum]|uniref:Hypp4108 protein n=1 Tax=Branchiostoma lanceolatum TaxID=7740 RepID=A0A8K0EWZ2_BRALA|nr:Hypp4108 [Branchiostoma lanceolatum]
MLAISDNPFTSIFDVSELKHISWLMLSRNKIQCDCRLRQIKRWILANELSVWISCIVKATGKIKHVRYIQWDDLRCSSPDVSVIVDNGTVTGNASLTCQTDCLDGLTFSWITPSGHHSSSSYEDSKNYIRENKSSCKGSPVTTLETRRMCFSVLSISTVGNDTDGIYTCQVKADHAANASVSVFLTVDDIETVDRAPTPELLTTSRNTTEPAGDKDVEEGTAHCPGHGLSTSQLIFAVLGSFCGFYVIVGVVAACVSKCKEGRQKDNAGGQGDAANRHYENDDQFSDTDGASEHDYENDDQFSDTDGSSEHDYENDDQFSDTDGSSEHDYENDDQFSDTDGSSEHDYENDDQFSDTDGARGGHTYENDDQLSDTDVARGGHAYENDDQLSDTDVARGGHAYENDDQFSDTDGAKGGHYENDDQFSDDDVSKHSHKAIPGEKTMSSTDKARRARRLHSRRALVKAREIPSNDRAKAIANTVAVHAEAQSGGHYDNERSGKSFGRRCSGNKARTTANNVACDEEEQSAGHYDNDRKIKGLTLSKTPKTDDDSDSDHDYMSLPPNGPTEGDTGGVQCESTPVVMDPASASDHGYMTLPGTENSDEQQEEHLKDGQVSGSITSSSNTEGNPDHTYVPIPQSRKSDEQQEDLYGTE